MSGSRTEQAGTGHVDGQVWERPGHWSLCCAEGGGLRCPGPDQRPRDRSLGRQRWYGWVGIRGHLGDHPDSRWRCAWDAAPCLAVPGSEQGGCLHQHLPTVPRGGLPWCRGSVQGCNRQLAAEKLVWEGTPTLDQVARSGCPRVHLALAPLGPLCSKGRKATGLLPALGRGGQPRAAVMATECCVERPSGPAEVRVSPWFSSTGRYCTEHEEGPIREEGNQASFFFLPFFTLQGLWVPSRRTSPRRT